MATLIDMLDGAFPARLTLCLSQSPLVQPVSLDNLVPATFDGYQPADLIVTGRAPPYTGWGYVAGFATFIYRGPLPSITVTAVYLTAYDRVRTHLIHAIPVAGTAYSVLRLGMNTISVEFAGNVYVPPG